MSSERPAEQALGGPDWLTFGSVIAAAAVSAGATTIANAVLPQMQGDLSASLDQISWVVTASVVAAAIGTPPTPWLASRFGGKQLFLASMLAFSVTSAMIGLSRTLEEVVLWRILQAVSAAPILALSQTFTLAAFPVRRRGLGLAIWSIALTGGWVFAPPFGAYVAEHQSWRLVFFALAPLGIAATVVCAAFVPKTDKDTQLRFDWFGFVALSVALAGLQIVLNRGQRLDWFDSPRIVIWTVAGSVAIYVFVVHSLTTPRPFFNWQVFKDKNLSVGLALTFAFAFISLVPLVLMPAMLERLRGIQAVTIGLMLVPEGVVEIVGLLLIAPFIGRVDARLLVSAGFLIYALGAWMMTGYNLAIGFWDVIVPLSLQGFAMSIIWLPVFHMLYSTIAERYRTDGAALVGLTYSISSSTGIALSVTLLTRSAQRSSEELGAHVAFGNELFQFAEYRSWDLSAAESLASLQVEVAQQALMIGYVNVFWMLTWVCLAAVPVVMLFGSSGLRPKRA